MGHQCYRRPEVIQLLRVQALRVGPLLSAKRAIQSLTILFAIVGLYATCDWTRNVLARPHHFAKPFSFVILDIENPKNPGSATRIYLDPPSSLSDVRFEGSGLHYRRADLPHSQSSVPFPGYIISGEGRIVFGLAVLEIKDGEVRLNGLDLCRRELIISRSGESWQGMLRIAR